MTRVPPPAAPISSRSSGAVAPGPEVRSRPAAAEVQDDAARTSALGVRDPGAVARTEDALETAETSAPPRSALAAAEALGRSAVHAISTGVTTLASELGRRFPIAVAAVVLATAPLAFPASGAPIGGDAPTPARITATVARASDAAASLDLRVSVDRGARGAYFRKVVTGTSPAYRGLATTGTLPVPTFDPARLYTSPHGPDDFRNGPLDRPSVYLGGRGAGHELDAGLTWDRVYDPSGRATYTDRTAGLSDGRDPAHRFVKLGSGASAQLVDGSGKVVARGHDAVAAMMKTLAPNFAFRPYFRTTNGDGDDWHQPAVGAKDNVYFYPGEDFAMTVRVTKKSALELVIRTADGSTSYATDIHQVGFGGAKGQSFKRVMSIDQFTVDAAGERTGLEGRDVLSTGTRSLGGKFDSAAVLTATKSGEVAVPMRGRKFTEVHGGDTHARYGQLFHLSGSNARGGEQVDITPR